MASLRQTKPGIPCSIERAAARHMATDQRPSVPWQGSGPRRARRATSASNLIDQFVDFAAHFGDRHVDDLLALLHLQAERRLKGPVERAAPTGPHGPVRFRSA